MLNSFKNYLSTIKWHNFLQNKFDTDQYLFLENIWSDMTFIVTYYAYKDKIKVLRLTDLSCFPLCPFIDNIPFLKFLIKEQVGLNFREMYVIYHFTICIV